MPQVFPHGINQGASFDLDLISRIGNATAIESRATNNLRYVHSGGQAYAAILCDGGPLANTAVHTQWGRTAESFGECPYATGEVGRVAVNAMQQRSAEGKRLSTAVVTRHYMGAHQSNLLGHAAQMNITSREMSDHYVQPYRAQLVSSSADGVMCSFSNFNGTPACANKQLLQTELRETMQSDACVVSDCCDSITSIKSQHHMSATYSESIALAVNAGAQLCFGCDPLSASGNPANSIYFAKQALDREQITPADLDSMTARNLLSRFKLGEFDGSANFIDSWAWTVPMLDKFQSLAREAAAASVVMVKNSRAVLPLARGTSVAVVGPFAHCEGQEFAQHPKNCYLQGYNGNPSVIKTILDGVRELSTGSVAFESGCEIPQEKGAAGTVCSSATIAAAATAATNADVTVAVVGLGPAQERESKDRTTLDFPSDYKNLLAAIAKASKQLVLVSISAGGVSSTWTAPTSPADSILFAGYPGQNADGVADVLYGVVSPSARLPITVYGLNYLDRLGGPGAEVNYHLAPPLSPVGKTYRYLDPVQDPPLWSFGFGIGYSRFAYSNLSVRKTEAGGAIVTAAVANIGNVSAAEVSQLYVSSQCVPALPFPIPRLSLRAFVKNHLLKGEKLSLRFELTNDDFKISSEDGARSVPPSCRYTLSVGGAQPGDVHATSNVLNHVGFKP